MKDNFKEIHPSSGEDLYGKKIFDRRQPLIEDDLSWGLLDGRKSWMEEKLGWKTPFDGK